MILNKYNIDRIAERRKHPQQVIIRLVRDYKPARSFQRNHFLIALPEQNNDDELETIENIIITTLSKFLWPG